jgi:hypothetical protein
MKISIAGLARLKPFDEKQDHSIAGSVYAGSVILKVGVISSVFLAAAALLAAVQGSVHASNIVALAVAVSALTAGMEWHAGLRARALNQLFVTVLCACVIAFVI